MLCRRDFSDADSEVRLRRSRLRDFIVLGYRCRVPLRTRHVAKVTTIGTRTISSIPILGLSRRGPIVLARFDETFRDVIIDLTFERTRIHFTKDSFACRGHVIRRPG